MHDGPWFCESYKGTITIWGASNVIQDWPLIDHLWTGWLPQDMDKAEEVRQLGETYWACGNELLVLLSTTPTLL